MNIPADWIRSMGQGVRVGLMDTGLSKGLPVTVAASRSFCGTCRTCNSAHADAMAQIIAGNAPDALGFAPHAEIVHAKVLDRLEGSPDRFARALQWLIDEEGCQVVNMSFASRSMPDLQIQHEMMWAEQKGVIMCGAWSDGLPFPSRCPPVIPCGARGRVPAGLGVLIAPGEHLVDGQWIKGHSVATAIISGVAACAKGVSPELRREAFVAELWGAGR